MENKLIKQNLLDFTPEELQTLMAAKGQKPYRAAVLFKWLHSGAEFSEMSDFPLPLREELDGEYFAQSVKIREKFLSKDGTAKYLFGLNGGQLIESVLMSYTAGNTLCVSSQAGCRMGCVFCASGADGLFRSLSAGEILGQIAAVNRELGGTARDRKIQNVVLMGSGEPLDNYEAVTKFLRLVMDNRGLNLGQRCISLSTCGIAPKIRRLADDGFTINLTVSLHSGFNEERNAMMPINKSYPVEDVMSAARYYFDKTGRRVMLEYTLIKGKNMRPADVLKLKNLSRGFPCHINLILLNPIEGSDMKAPTRDEAEKFKGSLEALGVLCTVRRALGSDIGGACGQLRSHYMTSQNEVPNGMKK
ncbi:putative dual-specificity RNA methyltransferase RlmN [Clostridia bacterium]|nr:putative dual-specificity RNA methyltransferase RlmN [Clostridia bacterium]